MRYLIALVVALFFSACGLSYPQWYVEDESDATYLYGVGEGQSLQEAKLAALNDIASKISLKVESNTNIQKEQVDSQISSKVSNDIAISISDIALDSVEYVESEQIDDVFFIKARIEKSVLISKLNNKITSDCLAMKGILDEVRKTKCATMTPRDKYKIQNLFDGTKDEQEQIKALGGKVTQQAFLDSVKNILSNAASADYASFAKGGDTKSYQLIENALMSEYSKFFALTPKDSTISHIENVIKVDKSKQALEISINASIKDCNGNALFSAHIEGTQDASKTANDLILRLRAQLYKKLDSWITN